MLNKNILINECLNIIRIYKLHIVESDPLLSFRFVFCFCFVLLFCFVFLLFFFVCWSSYTKHLQPYACELSVDQPLFSIYTRINVASMYILKSESHWLQISFIYIVNALALIRLVLVANDDLLTNNVIWLYSM